MSSATCVVNTILRSAATRTTMKVKAVTNSTRALCTAGRVRNGVAPLTFSASSKRIVPRMQNTRTMADRTFTPDQAHGGKPIDAKKTALVMIEYQNEFATEGGKLHDAVKVTMGDMLEKSVAICDVARSKGAKIMHTPITFNADMSDNPNKGLGILAGCAEGELFVRGTWNAELCEGMTPKEGDFVVEGKRGLDAFPGSNLEALLVENGIETIALGGFLTNCCVESTMRTAYEKGFNVITLTDCTAATSPEGLKAATEGTFGMFSQPMTSAEFAEKLGS